MGRAACVASPGSFPLQLPVHSAAYVAGLAAGEPHGREDHLGMAPLPLVDQLPLDVAHSGVGLSPGGIPPHQSGHVQVLDDQVTEFPGYRAGHLVLRVVSQSPDAPLALVDLALGFPPAPGSLLPPGLGPLPSPEFLLHLVAGFGVLVDLSIGVGAQGVDPGVDAAGSGVPLRFGLRWFPELQADVPPAVFPPDVGLVADSLGQGATQLDAAQAGEFHPALAVVADLLHAAGGQE